MTFSPDGEYLLSGGKNRIQLWQVEGGKPLARMEAQDVSCLAVSQDGRWIAAGTGPEKGSVLVWDTVTNERVLTEDVGYIVGGIDFSPDSTRLVVAACGDYTHYSTKTVVWDIATRKQVQTLDHDDADTAKYSPQGNRIATARYHGSRGCVRIWDSNDGRFKSIQDIENICATEVLWQCDGHLLVNTEEKKIMQIDAPTGTISAEWPVNSDSLIAIPKHGEFIACSTGHVVTISDVSTRAQIGLIQHTRAVHSIALSPDGRFLAISDNGGKIIIASTRLIGLPT